MVKFYNFQKMQSLTANLSWGHWIESNFLQQCLNAEMIYVCNKDGYIGNTVMFEIGYLLAKNKNIEFMETPTEDWVLQVVSHYSNLNDRTLQMVKN